MGLAFQAWVQHEVHEDLKSLAFIYTDCKCLSFLLLSCSKLVMCRTKFKEGHSQCYSSSLSLASGLEPLERIKLGFEGMPTVSGLA